MIELTFIHLAIGVVLFCIGWFVGFTTGHARGKIEAIESGVSESADYGGEK